MSKSVVYHFSDQTSMDMDGSIHIEMPSNFTKNINCNDLDDINKRNNCTVSCGIDTWVKLFNEYALDTTFHGPKQFAKPQPFIIRRVIWLLIFLAGTAIFLMQTITSIQKYYSFPVSVNVKVNYNTSIAFPAVTICNGNAFRSTKAYENDFYRMITDIYGNPNYTNVSIYEPTPDLNQLYTLTGHAESDLIVSCVWNNRQCMENDFVVTMTDYGRCFTFNSGTNSTQRKAYRTGTNGGLQLQLNTEQYEYMVGPNAGAGLKVMIHNPNDIAMVREHGLAVPPGSHGLIGIKTSVINNLPPKYGICNDSVKLEYFKEYTVQNCYINCKQKYLNKRCNCRDIYMLPKKGLPKVCNVNLYNTCMKQAQEDFYSNVTGICKRDCPIPCVSVLHQPSVSYASISNFDIEALLRRDATTSLQQKYINAKEITQRVNRAIMKRDTKLISKLDKVVQQLDTSFQWINDNIHHSEHYLKTSYEQLLKRVQFHYRKALGGVRYVVQYNFIRGWEMYTERSFHYVILNLMDFPKSIKSTITNAFNNDTLSYSNAFTRNQIFLPLQAQLEGRRDLLSRARQYVKEVNTAYLSDSKPLLTYQFTKNRRYDLSYIEPKVINARYWDWNNTYNSIIKNIGNMDFAIDMFMKIGNEFVTTGFFNDTYFEQVTELFITGGQQFNYRMFIYETNVVRRPLDNMNKHMANFEALNTTLHDSYTNVEWKISQIKTVHEISTKKWESVLSIRSKAKEYLNNLELTKTSLGIQVMDKEFTSTIQTLLLNFQEIRTRISQLLDALTVLSSSYQAVWKSMLTAIPTQKFYKQLYGDCVQFLAGNNSDYLIPIFYELLHRKIPKEQLKQMNPKDVVAAMNGDIHGLNVSDFLLSLEKNFTVLKQDLDLPVLIGSNDALFSKYINALQTSLGNFMSDNEIGANFYKQNFMTLDIFMKELSYEEITQQQAYDIPQMLSEIGGSMGLFIGGSVLSAFEFLDVFIHHAARVALNR